MKLLEEAEARRGVRTAAVLCSVPPSGNGPMTGRYLRSRPLDALTIVRGFVLKAAATNAQVCRALFFGGEDEVSSQTLLSYMARFGADSRVGLDLRSLQPLLPAASSGTPLHCTRTRK